MNPWAVKGDRVVVRGGVWYDFPFKSSLVHLVDEDETHLAGRTVCGYFVNTERKPADGGPDVVVDEPINCINCSGGCYVLWYM